MAKAMVVCLRRPGRVSLTHWAAAVDARIRPDNAPRRAPYIHEGDGVLVFVHNPSASVQCDERGWCLGATAGAGGGIFEPGSGKPEGSYALCRIDASVVEVLSDYTASRTIWYYHDADRFIAATSQRLIVALLGAFQAQPAAAKWMLASGTLGPGYAWDRRLTAAAPNATLRLDRASFRLASSASSLAFAAAPRSGDEHKRRLSEAVGGAVAALDIDPRQWALALSGGMDSRSLYYHLPADETSLAVTWGLAESRSVASSDAAIAARLALRRGIAHRYFQTDADRVPFARTMTRFLAAGEGRIDHISGYMDGLELWRELAGLGRDIIRGYDAMGSKWPVASVKQARALSGLRLATDYHRQLIPAPLAVGGADLPAGLARGAGERLDDYRDRLWLEFRTPYLTAALDDIKAAYVEICNPLLCRRVVDVVRELPAALRSHKRVFEKIVQAMFPDIPFAKYVSTESVEDILTRMEARAYLREVLDQDQGGEIWPAEFLGFLQAQLAQPVRPVHRRQRLLDRIDANLPAFIKRLPLLGLVRETLDVRRLALRAAIVIAMHRLLREDAAAGAAAAG